MRMDFVSGHNRGGSVDLDLLTLAEQNAERAQQLEAFSAINLRHVRGELSEALTHFGRLGLLEEYTKHDISHIDAMLSMYDWLVPEETQRLMTPADWLLVTLSTYLHDFGLLVTRDEFDAREQLEAYLLFRRRIVENDDPDVRDYRSQVQLLEGEAAERFMYQEFVRQAHAQRIRGWLLENPDLTWGGDTRITNRLRTLLHGMEETFVDDVGLVCESHHLDDINDTRKYPVNKPYGRTRDEEANVQYAALLLRTSDLLHITKDRVPAMAALVVNPRNPKSQVEWAKQSAVRSVRPKANPREIEGDEPAAPDSVEVHATFKDSDGYFGLTSYLQYASRQLAQSFAWSRENQNTGLSAYEFPWRRVDMSHIEARGFVAQPFEFSIDQAKILDLLTGHTLYNDTGVVVRELVQNALDAVRLKQFLSPDGDYTPRIDVYWRSADRVLEVVDNGIGMTQSVIEQNFLRVGSSRYQEPEFKKSHPDFFSISRFGIGVLSTFMVADDVSVSTSHNEEVEARQLSLRDVHGQYLVRLVDKGSEQLPDAIRAHGTAVRLKLRPSARLVQVPRILKYWILFPGCELWLHEDGGDPKQIGYASVEEGLTELLVESNLARRTAEGLSDVYGSAIQVRTAVAETLEIAYAVSWSRWLEEWQFVRHEPGDEGPEGQSASDFGVSVGGVRVTTQPPGFVAGGIAALANAYGKGAPRTNVARSALERTEEYDNLLRHVYSAYTAHIATEADAMVQKRAASLTRAVQEASIMTEDLARFEPESTQLRDSTLRGVPALIVERDGARRARSIQDLDEESELATIEGTTIASFESVLRSVRGATSPSLRNLLDALGVDERLPEGPLLCGSSTSNGRLISRMFTSEWEVVKFATDTEKRSLRAFWRRIEDKPRWQAAPRRSAVSSALATRLERGMGSSGAELTWILFATTNDVSTEGFQETLVSCQGRLHVLPGDPFLEIQPAEGHVSDPARWFCIAWLVQLLANVRPNETMWGRPFSFQRARLPKESRTVDTYDQFLQGVGIYEVLDRESVLDVLSDANLDALDVNRWDRRLHGLD